MKIFIGREGQLNALFDKATSNCFTHSDLM